MNTKRINEQVHVFVYSIGNTGPSPTFHCDKDIVPCSCDEEDLTFYPLLQGTQCSENDVNLTARRRP